MSEAVRVRLFTHGHGRCELKEGSAASISFLRSLRIDFPRFVFPTVNPSLVSGRRLKATVYPLLHLLVIIVWFSLCIWICLVYCYCPILLPPMATNHLLPGATTPSLHSPSGEDWDRWVQDTHNTSQNSIQFPGTSDPDAPEELSRTGSAKPKRTLSELLKLHAERGTDVNFSPEEADRVAEVLKQWVSRETTFSVLTSSMDVEFASIIK